MKIFAALLLALPASASMIVGDIQVCYLCQNNFGISSNADGPSFIVENTSSTDINGGVLTLGPTGGSDSFNVGTVPAGGNVIVQPGISNDGAAGHTFFAVTGTILDTSDAGPNGNDTQFEFTGTLGSAMLDSGIFTPGPTVSTSNDGLAMLNFLGGAGNADDPCQNCFGPQVVATLSIPDQPVPSVPEPSTLGLIATSFAALGIFKRKRRTAVTVFPETASGS